MKSEEMYKFLENLNMQIQIDVLLFDIILDAGFKGMPANEYVVERHNHSSYEVHFIKNGEGILCINEEKIQIYSNSFYIVAPGIYHSFIQNPGNPIEKYYMKFSYNHSKARKNALNSGEANDIIDVLCASKYYYTENSHNIFPLIYEIHKEIEAHSVLFYSYIQTLFAKIIINIIRSISPISQKNQVIPKKIKDDKRDDIIEHFFDNFNQNLSIFDLANIMNISERQLNRILKKNYNTTFKQKLIDTRIIVAKELLRNTEYSIDTIAQKVGYENLRNFSMLFKKNTGINPKMYREKCK